MSWWISEVLSTNRDMTERLCKCECDDTSVFPDAVQYKEDTTTVDYTIVRGSYLYCLSNSKTYRLNTSNQWVEQKDSTLDIDADSIIYDNTSSGLTATTVQDAIDELKDENDTQDNALAELYGEQAKDQILFQGLINKGAKNVFNIDAKNTTSYSATYTVSDDTMTINGTGSYSRIAYPITLKAGDWHFKCNSTVSSGNYRVRFNTASAGSGTTIADDINFTDSGTYQQDISLSDDTTFYIMFYSNSTSSSGTTTASFSSIMLCTKAEWDVTQLYQPYGQTNPELTKEKTTITDIFGQGKALYGTYTSLNDVMTAGRYYVATGSQAATISDSPYTSAGYGLYVMASSSDFRPAQILLPNPVQGTTSTYGMFFKREYIYNAWGPWFKFTGVEVATVNVQSISPSLNTPLNLRSEELDTNFELLEGLDEGDDLDDI